MKGVSIIIACYKAGSFLRDAVESLHRVAPAMPYEIIIVDDASNDKLTNLALQALELTDRRVRIVEQPYNQGQSAARNRAIEMARYDYIFPFDADDKMNPALPGYMDEAVRRLQCNPDTIAVYSKGQFFGARKGPFLLSSYSERAMLTDNMIPVYGIYRRADALEIGGYKEDLRYTEDWEIWNALHGERFRQNRPRNVELIAKPHYLYRQHEHGENVSRARRMPIVEHMAAISSRSLELYDHHFGTTDPTKLAEMRAAQTTFLKATFRRFAANSPMDVLAYTTEWVSRKYPDWRKDRAAEMSEIAHRHN